MKHLIFDFKDKLYDVYPMFDNCGRYYKETPEMTNNLLLMLLGDRQFQ